MFEQRATAPLVYRHITMTTQSRDDWPGWFPRDTLGEALELQVDTLAGISTAESGGICDLFRKVGLAVGLIDDGYPSARIFGHDPRIGDGTGPIVTDVFHQPGVNHLLRPPAKQGRIPREAILRFALLVVLGELWDDTRKRNIPVATPQTGDLPADATPRNENGAPGRAPPTRNQDHDLAIPEGHAPEYKRESVSTQALLSRGPGRPCPLERMSAHDHANLHTACPPLS